MTGVPGDVYRLERELSGGGMSRVFVAGDVEPGRKVVVVVPLLAGAERGGFFGNG